MKVIFVSGRNSFLNNIGNQEIWPAESIEFEHTLNPLRRQGQPDVLINSVSLSRNDNTKKRDKLVSFNSYAVRRLYRVCGFTVLRMV
jgi:hypothetical protein